MKLYSAYLILTIAVITATGCSKDKAVVAAQQTQPGGKKETMNLRGYIVKSISLEEKIYSTGSVIANEEAEIRSEVAGKLVNLSLSEGAYVQKGKLLGTIFSDDLKAQYQKLEIEELLAVQTAARLKKLLEANGISQEEFDIAKSKVLTLQADKAYVAAQIEKTKITAPFNGVLGLRAISEGSYVTSQDVITTIQQINPIKIDFEIPEKYAGQITKGGKIEFFVEGVSGNRVATIIAIDPKIDPLLRTLKARATYENKNGEMTPGAFAKIELILQNKPAALTIPTEAIIPILKGKKVFVKKQGKAEERVIETGIRLDNVVEVLSGLQVGDTVLTSGIMSLRNGLPVEVNQIQTDK